MAAEVRDIDEPVFESVWKKDERRGLAPWESFAILRELRVYDPVPNLSKSAAPVLMVIGDRDTSMPLAQGRETFERLRAAGREALTLRAIAGEVHQYRKYDVFLILDAWIGSGGLTAEFAPTAADRQAMERAEQRGELEQAIASLPGRGAAEKAMELLPRAKELRIDQAGLWFKLGMLLTEGRRWEEAREALERTLAEGFPAPHAPWIWLGHGFDLKGERAEALDCYRKAQAAYNGIPVRQDQWGMVLDEAWIAERLRTPFAGR
jgi:tetratricopeptide (TPR) repeat protein